MVETTELNATREHADTSAAADSVTVIIATYNRTRYLRESLDSILSQSHPPHQVILIDDGSDEDTSAAIAPYGDRVTCVWQPNAGRAAALNRGLALATGEWIWCFDDDDVATPDAIERRLDAARAQPEVDIVFSEHYLGHSGPDGRIVKGRHIGARAPANDRLLINVMHNFLFPLVGALVRRRCYEELGGFDASFLRGADYAFTVRLLRKYRAAVLREPTFIWREHEGLRGPKALRHGEADRKKVWKEFDGRLGRQIRTECALGEFLAPPVVGRALTFCEARLALLTRMSIMATKGLVDEALDDLAAAAEITARCGNGALSVEERRLCVRAMTHPYWLARISEDPADFLMKLRERSKAPLMPLFAGCLARGLLHAARKSEHVAAHGRAILWRVWLHVAAYAGPRPVVRAYLER
jgi:hypothetical protein